jgi:hypothetical protein
METRSFRAMTTIALVSGMRRVKRSNWAFRQGKQRTALQASGFGDFSGAMSLAAVVDGSAQAGKSDDLLGMGKREISSIAARMVMARRTLKPGFG